MTKCRFCLGLSAGTGKEFFREFHSKHYLTRSVQMTSQKLCEADTIREMMSLILDSTFGNTFRTLRIEVRDSRFILLYHLSGLVRTVLTVPFSLPQEPLSCKQSVYGFDFIQFAGSGIFKQN